MGGGRYFINDRDTHVCYMTFVYMSIFQKVRYWYGIWDVQVPIFRALWVIGTNSSQFEICELCNLRSPYRHEQAGRVTPMLEYLMQLLIYLSQPKSKAFERTDRALV